MAVVLEGIGNVRHRTERRVMTTIYRYKLVKENLVTGKRSEYCGFINIREPLVVGALYVDLNSDFPGFWRVLEEVDRF